MEEIWKTIKSHDKYKISNFGRVYSKKNNIILKTWINPRGYEVVSIYGKWLRIHRLVGIAFIKNNKPSKFNIVNHIDGNKSNNNYKNLEWCDSSYNRLHAIKIGLIKPLSTRKLTMEQANEIRKSTLTNPELYKKYNTNYKTVQRIKKNLLYKNN